MISDFQIHAFVDRELDSREQSEILCEAARSPELAMRIADLQQLKHLLKYAYENAESRDSCDTSVPATMT
jgi:hypothetical protein